MHSEFNVQPEIAVVLFQCCGVTLGLFHYKTNAGIGL